MVITKISEKNKITKDQIEEFYNNINPVTDLNDAVKEADLIIEAVPEDFNIKRNLYKELDQIVDSNRVIYASNTRYTAYNRIK